jgi:NAD+ synthetase
MRSLKIAVLQHNPIVADVKANFEKLQSMIHAEMKRESFDLFVAPELALVGYSPRDLLSQPQLLKQEQEALEAMRVLSQELNVGILLGHTERHEGTGKALFNSCTLFDNGYCLGRIRKRRIPHYDIFMEERFFESARDLPQKPIPFRGFKLGLFICEDGWWEVRKFGKNDAWSTPWAQDMDSQLAGSHLLINLSASPFEFSKYDRRKNIFARHALTHQAPLIFSTCVGAQDEIIFDGPSFVMNSQGEVHFESKSFVEDVLRIRVCEDKSVQSLDAASAPTPKNSWETLFNVLTLGIRDFVRKNKFEKVLLGLSGGIDSALVALLAKEALGAQNVLGISLPTRFNSQETRKDAAELAKALGIGFREISIESAVVSTQNTLQVPESGLVFENLQSRMRGLFLMTISAQENRLLLATGNKSEFAMGYSTLYGDMCGALAPIGDLYKTEVFGLCHWIQQKMGAPFPEGILSRAPSAELAPHQKDEDSLPPYPVLDVILADMIDNQFLNKKMLEPFARNTSKISLEEIEKRLHHMEFKRFQAPPILKIHSRAFGYGWQMPLVKGYPP